MIHAALKNPSLVSIWAIPGLKKGSYPGLDNKQSMTLKKDQIIQTVCEHYNLESGTLKTRSRKREKVVPRQLVMYFMKKYMRWSLKAIGDEFGRDHTTVIHSINTIEDLRDTEPGFNMEVNYLESKII